MLESSVSQRTQMALQSEGGIPWRNNVGVAFDDTGRAIRYGLMNESKAINEKFKSSDLIGIAPILIQPWHVGRTMGVFVALETKKSDWKMLPSDKRAKAQLNYMMLVRQYGGIAGFISNPAQVGSLLGIYR